MALQYSIWTLASNRHEIYGSYHDAFYRRARQYLEADELKVGKSIIPESKGQVLTTLRDWENTSCQLHMHRRGH